MCIYYMKTLQKSKKRRNRLPKNKTEKPKSISLTTLHDGKITIMTFNVELFLRLYDFAISSEDVIEDATIIRHKMTKFSKLFSNIDIACLQETYVSGENPSSDIASLRVFDKKIRHLQLQDICASHILDWPNSLYLYGDPSYLANAIYISKDIPILQKGISNSDHNIHTQGLPRCFSMATIFVDSIPIKVISVHLVGGRFDDIEAIQSDDYIEEKKTQIKAVVAMDPDIICGDFNTKFRTPVVETATDMYFESILEKIPGVSKKTRAIYKSRWDKWIYMDTIHTYLKSAGYKSVYHSDAGELDTTIRNTSAFGGIVDMIYYKSNKLRLDKSSVDIVGYNAVMQEREDLNTFEPVLSDHFPVKATFSMIPQ